MKNSILTLLVLSLLSISCNRETIYESDILVNNSFEEGTDTPDGWYAYTGAYEVDWSDAEAYKSDRSVLISSDVASNDFAFYAQDIDNFEGGKVVELSVRIKKEEVRGSGLAIAIRGDSDITNEDAEWFTTTQTDRTIIGTSGWQKYILKSETKIPSDMISVTVYLIMLPQTKGMAYFDDVVLEYVDQ